MTIADRNELRQPAYGEAHGVAWLAPIALANDGVGALSVGGAMVLAMVSQMIIKIAPPNAEKGIKAR